MTMTSDLMRTLLSMINLLLVVGIFIIVFSLSTQLRQFFSAATALLIELHRELQEKNQHDQRSGPTRRPCSCCDNKE